jgi:hypothetical protein
MHVTGEQAKHFAYVISECSKRNIRTIEPTEAAEKKWCDTIVAGTAIRAEFFKECTPGYYNNEGKPSMTATRNATYGGGSPAFLKILTDWRKANDLKGLDVRSFDRKEEETAPEEQVITAKAPEQNSTEHIEAVSAIPLTNGAEDKETEGKTVESSPVQNGTKEQAQEEDTFTDIVNNPTDSKAAGPVFPASLVSPAGDDRSLIQKYSDLHAKHQSELNDLLSQQRSEVERFLKNQSKRTTNGVNGVH